MIDIVKRKIEIEKDKQDKNDGWGKAESNKNTEIQH